mgnify:CR=1 FL=1
MLKISEIVKRTEEIFDLCNAHFYDGELPRPAITVFPDTKGKILGWCTLHEVWTTETESYREINLCAEYLDRPIVYGWVACSVCGNTWRTRAGYIRQIDGASQFRDTFRNEDATVMRYLTDEIHKLDEQIGALQVKRQRLEKRYKKRQAGKK